MRRGFTLMELLIVVTIIAILVAAVIALLNPWTQIGKAKDAQRKHDLDVLQKKFEEYFNDVGCYPRAEQVCYGAPQNICAISKTATSKMCNICGRETDPPEFSSFSPYLPDLPCDPEHPQKDYLYHVETPNCARNDAGCSTSVCPADYCPKWYRIYADFASSADQDSIRLGCKGGGCGVAPTGTPSSYTPFGNDYGVTSHQVGLEKSSTWFCLTDLDICNSCGTNYDTCLSGNNACQKDKIYPSSQECCQEHPGGC